MYIHTTDSALSHPSKCKYGHLAKTGWGLVHVTTTE